MNRITLSDLGEMMAEGKFGHLTEYCSYCTKIIYPTEADAKAHAAFLRGEGRNRTRAYSCPKGKGWHLTSKTHPPSAKAKRKRKPSKSNRTYDSDNGWR